MTKEELQDIKTRYETVTLKDWNLDVRGGCLAVYTGEKINCMASLEKDKTIYYSDGYRDNEGVWQNYAEKENIATFIAHSITDIPKLIDEIEHLQSEITRLKAEIERYKGVIKILEKDVENERIDAQELYNRIKVAEL